MKSKKVLFGNKFFIWGKPFSREFAYQMMVHFGQIFVTYIWRRKKKRDEKLYKFPLYCLIMVVISCDFRTKAILTIIVNFVNLVYFIIIKLIWKKCARTICKSLLWSCIWHLHVRINDLATFLMLNKIDYYVKNWRV